MSSSRNRIRTNLSNAALDISEILGNPLPQNDPNRNLSEELVRELEEGRESSITTSSMLFASHMELEESCPYCGRKDRSLAEIHRKLDSMMKQFNYRKQSLDEDMELSPPKKRNHPRKDVSMGEKDLLESLARKYILLCFSMRGFGSPTGLHGGSVGSTKFLSSFLSRELEERGMLEKLDVFLRNMKGFVREKKSLISSCLRQFSLMDFGLLVERYPGDEGGESEPAEWKKSAFKYPFSTDADVAIASDLRRRMNVLSWIREVESTEGFTEWMKKFLSLEVEGRKYSSQLFEVFCSEEEMNRAFDLTSTNEDDSNLRYSLSMAVVSIVRLKLFFMKNGNDAKSVMFQRDIKDCVRDFHALSLSDIVGKSIIQRIDNTECILCHAVIPLQVFFWASMDEEHFDVGEHEDVIAGLIASDDREFAC